MDIEALARAVETRFPGVGVALERGKAEQPSDLSIVIPAAHPGVGELVIVDDGDEYTAFIGNVTHGHFASAGQVIEFLEWLFADRVLMWKVWTGGGWRLETEPVTTHKR